MLKKTLVIFIFVFLLLLFFFVFAAQYEEEAESGVLSIYFQDERVGYEEYTWQSDEVGYILSVKGRMTKPVDMEIHSLVLRLDKSFIPRQFNFKFSVAGIAQEISSVIVDGQVENTIHVSGQEQKSVVKIKRDAFLLPNPVFSCYMVLAKKYRCNLLEPVELSAYIIPLFEVPLSLEFDEESPCSLTLEISGITMKMETDDDGSLKFLHSPAQKLKVYKQNP
ncbi:MAG: hypothetical protein GTO16_04810 [Candidatus Aminicenantes bacterium]|nr:hypothetical protein [Candidatus Aminicenantes bacterium]